jgi:hypothetical protein
MRAHMSRAPVLPSLRIRPEAATDFAALRGIFRAANDNCDVRDQDLFEIICRRELLGDVEL